MLAQGKKLADTFDSSRNGKTVKKTAVKKDNKAKEKKVATTVETAVVEKKDAIIPSGDSTMNSLMQEGQNTSTQQLETQAAQLVEQANAMMLKNQEMAQTQGG